MLSEDLDTLDDKLVEDLIADGMIVSALDDRVVDSRVDDMVPEVLALKEVSVVGVITFRLDEVRERKVEDDWIVYVDGASIYEDMGTAADVDARVVSRSFETVEDTVMKVSVFEAINDATVVDFEVVPRSVEVIVVFMDDDSVLEDVKDVVAVGNRASSRRDKTSKMSLPSGEDKLLSGAYLDVVRADGTESWKASRAHRGPTLRFGVGVGKIPDAFAETYGVADTEGTLVVLDDESRPGMLTGKHFGGKGFEEDHNGVDQGASYCPTLASIAKSTSIIASLSTLIPIFEAPASLPQTPFSSISTLSAHHHLYSRHERERRARHRTERYTSFW